ncbi:outer membrane protein transport protein [Aquimarina sp. U1-2]|uniref:outer membrane protein transport protein n=1 Tax=Aquimarina sp. U1-2 TaxID=2823141 RepID=UPI001AEC895D|nr:outer membrane protein transport protein [Aquimarina sp. U1-2]MBP2831695.1 outer membrane protein transport protein [Aquimarina sp. U1-2]
MIKKILVVTMVLVALMSNAQEGTSSPYSFYGVGIQKFKGTVENRAMGGLSIYADSIHLNLQNPASFGELRLTAYTVGASYNNYNINSQTESSSGDNATLDYLAIGIPAGKFGFGFGVIPSTAVGYQLENTDNSGQEERFTGTGGLNKVFLAAGFKANDNLSVGLDLNYNFGNIEEKSILSRPEVQFDTREITNANLSSFSLSLGLRYRTMISEQLELSVSVVSTPSFSLTFDSTRELSTILLGNNGQEIVVDRQETVLEDSEIDIPAEVKVGGGIGSPKKWFIGAEYVYTDSGDFTEALFIRENVVYSDASKFKIGGFFTPKYNSLTNYLSRVTYRAGFRYEETGLNINDQSIDEFGISFGVGLPVGRLFSNANFGFEYGQRGTKDFGLVREDFFNVSISLSLNDKWFRKIKFN